MQKKNIWVDAGFSRLPGSTQLDCSGLDKLMTLDYQIRFMTKKMRKLGAFAGKYI